MSTEMSMERMNLNSKNTNTSDNHNSHTDSDSQSNSDFEASVGMSRKWNARDAGREVAENTLKKLKHKPSFFLLFSTIHYEKHGGFQEFLNGVWDVLPKGTPLIGGTVAGFMTPEGCFTRGASAIAIYYPNMDIKIGLGKNTKRNPKSAVKNFLKKIYEDNEKYQNSILIDFVSGTKLPSFPIIGQRRVINDTFFPKSLLSPLMIFSTKYLQKGMGRENELLDEMIKYNPDSLIIGGSCNDDNSIENNFQFFKNNLLLNDIVGMRLNTDLEIKTGTADGLCPTDITFELSDKNGFGCIMKRLDGLPAKQIFLEKMRWPEDYLNEKTIFRKSYQYPICYFKYNSLQIRTFGLFFKDFVGVANDIEEQKLTIYQASGRNMIESYIGLTKKLKSLIHPRFVFGIQCGIILEALGNNIYILKDKINKILGEVPYLIVFTAGEHIYIPNKTRRHVNLSFNLAFFGEKNEEILSKNE